MIMCSILDHELPMDHNDSLEVRKSKLEKALLASENRMKENPLDVRNNSNWKWMSEELKLLNSK